jgi:hypothetical protein
MELSTNQTLYGKKQWHTRFNATDQSMELYFTDELADDDIDHYLHLVHDMVEFMPVKTLFINDNKIKKDPLGLDWKIIEASSESLCRKGGKRIVVIHQSNLPTYVQKTYSSTLEKYGIPIELEFRNSSTFNKQ